MQTAQCPDQQDQPVHRERPDPQDHREQTAPFPVQKDQLAQPVQPDPRVIRVYRESKVRQAQPVNPDPRVTLVRQEQASQMPFTAPVEP